MKVSPSLGQRRVDLDTGSPGHTIIAGTIIAGRTYWGFLFRVCGEENIIFSPWDQGLG
jgi:hypothetical protein